MAAQRERPARALPVVDAVGVALVAVVHLVLVVMGTGGVLGVLFVLDGIAGLALAFGLVRFRGPWLRLVAVLALAYLVAGLAALLAALTIGLFGITQTWDGPLVLPTVMVEAVATLVAIATVVAVRGRGQPSATSS